MMRGPSRSGTLPPPRPGMSAYVGSASASLVGRTAAARTCRAFVCPATSTTITPPRRCCRHRLLAAGRSHRQLPLHQQQEPERRRIAVRGRARASTALQADPGSDPDPDTDAATTMTTTTTASTNSFGTAVWNAYVSGSNIFTNLFPIWTLAVAVAALRKPALFLWLTTPYFTLSLGVLMLSMGITLTVEDFKRVLRRFNAVAIGFVGCYVVMPILAIALAAAFKLPPDLAAGVILIGAVNGGQASNLCTYIANGNVALSVMMTTSTTLGAMVFTPLIAKLLIGTVVPVDALGMAWSIVEVVLIPIAGGMLLNKYCNRAVKAFLPFSPVLGVAATCLLVGSSVAQCASPILAAGWSLVIPILLLHVLGGIAGYFMQAAAGYGEIVRRTTAIETAMKSSAFGFLLASLHFGNYMVRVPSAVSVVLMALVGSTMSVIWRYIPVNAKLKFDRSLANRKGPFDKFLKPATVSKPSK